MSFLSRPVAICSSCCLLVLNLLFCNKSVFFSLSIYSAAAYWVSDYVLLHPLELYIMKGEKGNKMKHKLLGNSRWWKITYIKSSHDIFYFVSNCNLRKTSLDIQPQSSIRRFLYTTREPFLHKTLFGWCYWL